jgi:HEAT repeat protein
MARRTPLFCCLLAVSISPIAFGQSSTPATVPLKPAPTTTAPADDMDSQVVTAPAHPQSKSELTAAAWKALEDALAADDKHVDVRIQGLAALGTMGVNARTAMMITGAFADKELDVRTAALLAAAQTKNHALIPNMRPLLDDKEPQVAFAAACALWKLGDHSGEDFLLAVVNGDSKANPSLVHGSMHQANRELHDPAAMARLGALEGASALLGPFGFGITAYEYIKKNGGNSARVAAIEDISQQHSPEIHKVLLGALTDKDPAVRAAAAKAVRFYKDADTQKALAMLLGDSKRPVQLQGAAAYLISAGVVATPPPTPQQP